MHTRLSVSNLASKRSRRKFIFQALPRESARIMSATNKIIG